MIKIANKKIVDIREKELKEALFCYIVARYGDNLLTNDAEIDKKVNKIMNFIHNNQKL